MTKDAGGYKPEDYMETYTGVAFQFGSPNTDMVRIVDIAHSLSMQCRYNGSCRKFYSVGEHSLILAAYVEKQPWATPRDALTMLLHDAAETYMSDLIRPIKARMPEFAKIESKVEKVIAEKFGTIYPLPKWVREYDSRICVDERQQVMLTNHNKWGVDHLEPLRIVVHFLSPELVKRDFLAEYDRLSSLVKKSSAAAK